MSGLSRWLLPALAMSSLTACDKRSWSEDEIKEISDNSAANAYSAALRENEAEIKKLSERVDYLQSELGTQDRQIQLLNRQIALIEQRLN